MSRFPRFLFFAVATLFFTLNAGFAQTPPPPTGIPPFGSFNRDAIDTVNVGNLNVHFEFPVFAKKGRGLDFYANLVHDNTLYQPYFGAWSLNYTDMIWQLSAPLMGGITFDRPTQGVCNLNGQQYLHLCFQQLRIYRSSANAAYVQRWNSHWVRLLFNAQCNRDQL
jgi:hypothetical protein